MTSIVAASVALLGSLIALVMLPARAPAVEDAALDGSTDRDGLVA
jgi:hypothetical protein